MHMCPIGMRYWAVLKWHCSHSHTVPLPPSVTVKLHAVTLPPLLFLHSLFCLDRSISLSPTLVAQVLINWRHLLRLYKGHPALLMWAMGNEPNLAGSEYTFATKMDEFFRFVGKAAAVRDHEENEMNGYHPHPIMVPLADTNFPYLVEKFDYSGVDVWGVQPYRGNTFGDLFTSYKSSTPLLVRLHACNHSRQWICFAGFGEW